MCCWTGTGASIAANKVEGIRAALCADAETARGARRWNDANVLALSLRATSPALLEEILDGWFAGEPSAEADDVANVRHVEESASDVSRKFGARLRAGCQRITKELYRLGRLVEVVRERERAAVRARFQVPHPEAVPPGREAPPAHGLALGAAQPVGGGGRLSSA